VEPSSVFYIALDKVVVIAGLTASGKSSYAYKLAQEQEGVILNGDSLQVYKGLEILTAQPTPEEQDLVAHRLYGILSPTESCSVARWLSLVTFEIQKAHEAGHLPFIVGGTGLYLKALLEGISPLPAIDPEVRKILQEGERPLEDLYDELQSVDPVLSQRLDPRDRQRITRGLEVFYGTGKPLSFWQLQKPVGLPYEFEKILFLPSKEELIVRIKSRLEEMLLKGVLDEVSRLDSSTLSETAQKAIGFREFSQFLEGHYSLEQTKELVLLHTLQYAKRQRTWFLHQFLE